MLILPDFVLHQPSTLDEAVRRAAEPDARLLGGGTDLLVALKHGLLRPRSLVSLRRIDALREPPALRDGGLRIPAGLTLAQIARSPLVADRYPALAAACRTVATPTIQGMATLGGNLALDARCVYVNLAESARQALGGCLKCDGTVCHVARRGRGCYAAHAADTIPALWLYEAEGELNSATGGRRVPLRALASGDGRRALQLAPGEIVAAVWLPPPVGRVVHRKLRLRQTVDFAQLLTAVRRDEGGWRAVVSAVGPSPVEVAADTPEALVEAAWRAAKPLGTQHSPAWWRKRMVRVEVGRACAMVGG